MLKALSVFAIGLTCLCGNAMAQDAKAVIANAQKALGGVKSITYSGSAKDVAFQQCGANATDMICRGTHDPMRPITNYVRVIDLTAPASRAHGSDEQSSGRRLDDADAWNVLPAGHAPAGGCLATLGQLAGVLHHALGVPERRGREQRDGEPPQGRRQELHRLTWSPAVKAPSGKSYVINGYVNEQNLVDRVETWLGDNIMGDMHILATYTGLEGLRRVMAPVEDRADARRLAVLRSRRDGGEGESCRRRDAGACTGAGRRPWRPRRRRRRGGGAPPALTVTSEKLGDGLYRLTTGPGSYDSVIVEFKDYVMMLEAGQSEARGLAYIAETKKLIPNKPIRYVMNTHPHSDHTGGLPALVAEGATIITQKNNEAFLDKALNTPRTLLNDTLAKNPKKAKIEAVAEKKVYSDGTRTVELYHVSPVPHSNGLMIAYIPKEKILFQGDFSLPAPGQPANDHVKALVPILEKLNLDFDRYINVHTSPTPQTKADLWKAMGK